MELRRAELEFILIKNTVDTSYNNAQAFKYTENKSNEIDSSI